jgi:hypothetical protein
MDDKDKLTEYQKVYQDIYHDIAMRWYTDASGQTLHIGELTAEELLDPLFSSVGWRDNALKADHRSGYVDGIVRRYRRWTHRSMRELPEDLAAIEIYTDELRGGVAQYIEHPEVHSKYLDWYCANTLVYPEWEATFSQMQFYLVGFLGRWRTDPVGRGPGYPSSTCAVQRRCFPSG